MKMKTGTAMGLIPWVKTMVTRRMMEGQVSVLEREGAKPEGNPPPQNWIRSSDNSLPWRRKSEVVVV